MSFGTSIFVLSRYQGTNSLRNGAVRAFIKPDASAELLQSQLADSLTSQPIVPNAATPPPNQDPPQVESRPTEAQIFVDQHQTQSAPLPSPATPISESSRTPVPARAIPEPAPTSSSLDKGKGKATDTVEEERKAKRLAAQKAQLERIRAEKAERDRILKQVKQDQIDRRKREQEQKAHQVKEEKTAAVQAKRSAPVNEVRISVRIFDGSSLRKTFAPTDTIHQEVRSWIDSNRPDGNAPYTLKQILTPQPSRSITLSEEGQTLGDLELGRTANLVMVPVKEYSDAYVGAGSGLAMKAASAGYGLVSGAVGLASGAVGSLLGWGGQAANSSSSSADSTSGGDTQTVPGNTSGGIKVRTLGQIRSEQRDQQFYNGNQVGRTTPRILLYLANCSRRISNRAATRAKMNSHLALSSETLFDYRLYSYSTIYRNLLYNYYK